MKPDRQAEIDALFERLFFSHQKPILNYLYRLLGDVARAEEVTQDVFVKAYRAIGRLPEDANHRAWLYRIATNSAYDVLRRRKLIQWLPLMENDSASGVHGSEARDAGIGRDPTGWGDLANRMGEQEAVQRALGQLPPKYRVPLILYSVQGYSTREIGEIIGISEGAVKTRLYRAREKFRQAYGGDT